MQSPTQPSPLTILRHTKNETLLLAIESQIWGTTTTCEDHRSVFKRMGARTCTRRWRPYPSPLLAGAGHTEKITSLAGGFSRFCKSRSLSPVDGTRIEWASRRGSRTSVEPWYSIQCMSSSSLSRGPGPCSSLNNIGPVVQGPGPKPSGSHGHDRYSELFMS
jgi:hypothetical protein